MHWRLFLMSGLLYLMPMPSDALTVVWLLGCCTQPWNSQMHWQLSDCQAAAPDRETVRCTLTIVCCESPLQSADCNVIRDEMSKILHLILKSSNALTIFDLYLLSSWKTDKLLINNADKTLEMKLICCIWCRCHQIQWQLFDFRRIQSSTIVYWRRRGVWCLLELQANWLTAKQAIYWPIEMSTRCSWWSFFADLTTELDRARWIWLVWNVLMKLFDVFFTKSINLRADFVFKKSSITVELQKCFLHFHSANIRWEV